MYVTAQPVSQLAMGWRVQGSKTCGEDTSQTHAASGKWVLCLLPAGKAAGMWLWQPTPICSSNGTLQSGVYLYLYLQNITNI
jgi:hypothetical protein